MFTKDFCDYYTECITKICILRILNTTKMIYITRIIRFRSQPALKMKGTQKVETLPFL